VRSQTYHPDAFTQLGIDLANKALIVVKSTQHFYAGFAPLAKEVRYVTTQGAIPPDYANIPFTKLTRPYWPRVEDPFTGANQP
jgi:microcystin degradation protein MlrC